MIEQLLKRGFTLLVIFSAVACMDRSGEDLLLDNDDDDDDDSYVAANYTCEATVINESLVLLRNSNNSFKPLNISAQIVAKKDGAAMSFKVTAVARDGALLRSSLPSAVGTANLVSLEIREPGQYSFRFGVTTATGPNSSVVAACSANALVEAAPPIEIPQDPQDPPVLPAPVPPAVRILSENLRNYEEVYHGASLFIGWSADYADTCSITGNGVSLEDHTGQPVRDISGIFNTGALTSPFYVFQASCTGPGGTRAASIGVKVLPLPTIEYFKVNGSATPGPLAPGGGPVKIEWKGKDAKACTLKGAGVALNQPHCDAEGEILGFITVNTLYELECVDGANPPHKVRKEILVKVPAPLKPEASLQSLQRSVFVNSAATLSWSSKDVSSCELTKSAADGSNPVKISDLKNASNFNTGAISAPSLFRLYCKGAGGEAESRIFVGIKVRGNIVEIDMPQNMCYQGKHCAYKNWGGNRDGKIPTVPLMTQLVPGFKIRYENMSGITIPRVHDGKTYAVQNCPAAIALQFKDAGGNVIPIANYGLLYFPSIPDVGYEVPANAVSVWGSMPDSAYFDNPPKRNHKTWTGGCHFDLELYK